MDKREPNYKAANVLIDHANAFHNKIVTAVTDCLEERDGVEVK